MKTTTITVDQATLEAFVAFQAERAAHEVRVLQGMQTALAEMKAVDEPIAYVPAEVEEAPTLTSVQASTPTPASDPLALWCEDCDFTVPAKGVRAMSLHARNAHHREPGYRERTPRLQPSKAA